MELTVLRQVAADDVLAKQMHAYALDATFPCLGARSAINSGRAHFGRYGSLGVDDLASLQALCDSLIEFSAAYPAPGEAPVTFIALFDDDVSSEEEFERRLWRHLQLLHDRDRLQFNWATDVSSDPASRNFSFSVAGRAFYIVGVHPRASRTARRAPVPCLVFNFHDQFELLRASGKYDRLQRAIRLRDIALQGNANPVLMRFGEASEARQYSGRAIDAGWQCPLRSGVADAG